MLGEKLKSLRESKGLLLKDVAKHLDVDIAFISRIERNEKAVNRQHLTSFASLYGVGVEEFIPLWIAQRVLHLLDGDLSYQEVKKGLKLVMNGLDKNAKN